MEQNNEVLCGSQGSKHVIKASKRSHGLPGQEGTADRTQPGNEPILQTPNKQACAMLTLDQSQDKQQQQQQQGKLEISANID